MPKIIGILFITSVVMWVYHSIYVGLTKLSVYPLTPEEIKVTMGFIIIVTIVWVGGSIYIWK